MGYLKVIFLVCFLSIINLMRSYSQDFNYAIDNRKNIIYSTFSPQKITGSNFGYARETKIHNLRTIFTANPLFSLGFEIKDFRIYSYSYGFGAGATAILGENHWKISTGFEIGFIQNIGNSSGYRAVNIFSSTGVTGGYYKKKWFSAAYIYCGLFKMNKQKYDERTTQLFQTAYPDAYQIEHLNTWIYYPIYFSSGIRVGYSFKERLDIVTSVGLFSFAREGYKYYSSGFSIYDNPNAGSYRLKVISSYEVQDIRLTVYYHFGKIPEVVNK